MYKITVILICFGFCASGQQLAPCLPWPPPQKVITTGVLGKDSIVPDSILKKYGILNEQQIMFNKKVWSFIDFGEKPNKILYNNNNVNPRTFPLYEVLNLWIVKGKIKCFKNATFGSSQNVPVSMPEFKRLGIQKDTIEERSIDEEGNEIIVKELRADTMSSDKILGFVVKEDWFFNKRSVLMEKKIVGLAPVYYDKRTHKNKELYWVYYPECCEVLDAYTTVNPTGSKDPYTFRQAFEGRKFSAYILKESNVYNREKTENSKGFEAEYENKKSKEKFESGEQDLWSK